MPIECSVELQPVGQEGFHAVDKIVMQHAFDIHNTLGRFCDERIYQEELAQRCRDAGMEAHREVLQGLLADWGAFLEASLYRDALLHLLKSPGAGIIPVEIRVSDRVVGTQKMCMLNAGTAWHLSAIRQHFGPYETHIRRLVSHTALERIHWINLNHKTITLKTLTK